MSPNACVIGVHCHPRHEFSKTSMPSIRLLAGLGVDGDAHMGATVQHRSRVAQDPTQPNLRQVHLIASELHDALAADGFPVVPGAMGENVTTRGIELHTLPVGTHLLLGEDACVELTGLRNPCVQLNGLHDGLLHAVRAHNPGVMAVVRTGGVVHTGDSVRVVLPAHPHLPLARV